MTTLSPGTKAIWRNAGYDLPVEIVGYLGELAGVAYYSIAGSSTGIPANELVVSSTFDATLQTFHELRQRLHRGGKFAYLWTPNSGQFYTDKLTGQRTESKRSVWFPVGNAIPLPRGWADSNVFFGIHPTSDAGEHWQRSTNATVSAINCLFAELDGKDVTEPTNEQIAVEFAALRADAQRRLDAGELLKLTPAKTLRGMAITQAKAKIFLTDIDGYNEFARVKVETMEPRPSVVIHSGGGYHLYWFLKDTFYLRTDADRNRAKQLQAAWVGYVGGDEGAKDLARVLRPIGTHNVKPKYAPNFPVVSLESIDYTLEYSIDELAGYLPAVDPVPAKQNAVSTDIDFSHLGKNDKDLGEREHSDHVYRVMSAYNARHGVKDALLACGYTDAGNDRLSRPGEPESKGVSLLDGKSYHHSGNDPLFEACGPHRLSAFDVAVHYDHGGDYERAADELGTALGIYDRQFIDFAIAREMERASTADFAEIIPAQFHSTGRWGEPVYRTGATDRALYINVLMIMRSRQRIDGLRMGLRALAETTNSDGVPVTLCSPQTVLNFLERVEGVLLDSESVTQSTGVKLTVLSLSKSVVSTLDTIYKRSTPKVSKVDTTGAPHEYVGDDAFLRGRSRPVSIRIAKNESNLCAAFPHYEEARLAHDSIRDEANREARAKESSATDEKRRLMGADLFATWREMKALAASEFLRSLGTFGLLVIDDLASNPGATRKEVAARRGLKVSAVAGAVRKLVAWELVTEERASVTTSKTYSAISDVWSAVKARTPECMTYTLGAQRRTDTLENALGHAKEHEIVARGTEDAQKAARRVAKIEVTLDKTLRAIHPDWTGVERSEWVVRTPERRKASTLARNPRTAVLVPGQALEAAWNELFDLTGKVTLSAFEFNRLRTLDAKLDAGYFAGLEAKRAQAHASREAHKQGAYGKTAERWAHYAEMAAA